MGFLIALDFLFRKDLSERLSTMVEEPDGELGSLPITIWSTRHLPSFPRSHYVHPTIRTFSHKTTNQQVTDDTHKTFSIVADVTRDQEAVQACIQPGNLTSSSVETEVKGQDRAFSRLLRSY